MKKFILLIVVLVWVSAWRVAGADITMDIRDAVSAPMLKWQQDCGNYNCGNSWYSSPAVADLDGNGSMEIIYGSYHLYVLNGATGSQQTKIGLGGRVWPGIITTDLDGDGNTEMATGDGGGNVSVFNHNGALVWSRQPTGREIRSLSAYDLDGDGDMELIAGVAQSGRTNTYIYSHTGDLLNGWPQLDNDTGYAAGVYNANIAVADLDGDGIGEIVAPSDVHYICAYEPDGVQIPANGMYDDNGATKAWGKVGVWESLDTELRGWGQCNGDRAESYRTNFAHGPVTLADIDGDGGMEVIAVGNVYDCSVGDTAAGARYTGVYLFNTDRSRYSKNGNDWRAIPKDTGGLLSNDYTIIENNQPNPITVDLDGDGVMEVLYSSYDGRVHAFWLDKTEHGSWPYSVYHASEGIYRFATEPTAADIDNDGYSEVIFASWPQKGSNRTGQLHILNYLGVVLHEVDLPAPPSGDDWNGSLAAPTLANIDNDADLEILINTRHTGLIAYDLPNSGQARVLWATGRGNYQRNGAVQTAAQPIGDLQVSPTLHNFGQVEIGNSSTAQSFTVSNVGQSNRSLGQAILSGSNAGMFLIEDSPADLCSGQMLAPSGTCTMSVTFHPTGNGSMAANLVITSDDPARPTITIPLSGAGSSGAASGGGGGSAGGGGGGCFLSMLTD